jgi:hypothetical protein
MRLHFLVAGLVAVGLFASQPDAWARGGGGGGGGGGRGSAWHGGGFHGGGFRGNGRFFGRGRFFRGGFFYGPGFAFYGYPWYGWDGWGYYGDYPYYAYNGGYYGQYQGQGDNSDDPHAPQYNSTRAVQAALAWRGFYSGRIDGVMGPETESAIRAFQKQQGVPVTGQIDSNLSKALQRRN